MVKIDIKRNLAGELVKLRCRGHAGFDDGQGLDLVCAAVSGLTGALGIGLTRVAALTPVQLRVGDGLFELELSDEQAASVRLLTESVVQALLELEEHYRGSLKVRVQPLRQGWPPCG